MSRYTDEPPVCEDGQGPVEMEIVSRERDLGGFSVRRALPSKDRRMVGPFIFLDQIGPASFPAGKALDVRPHPHIGLATVTYLYDGVIRHRDSLGYTQDITPGALNLMIAGKAITHSERTPEELRDTPRSLFGIQTWMALPMSQEERAPSFEHHSAESLPVLEGEGFTARIVLGEAFGQKAPGTVFTDTLYVDLQLVPGGACPVPDDHEERAVYIAAGAVMIGGKSFETGHCAVLRPGADVMLEAGEQGARVLLFGGAAADGPRHIWWTFVASDKDRIESAKEEWRRADWDNGLFSLPPNDQNEFIPIDD